MTRQDPPRGLRRIWRRGRDVVRDEGWSALLVMALADLGYRRFLLLERRLDEPIAAITPRLPVDVATLQPSELDEYLRLNDRLTRPPLEARVARGDECFLARYEGRMVAASWVSRDAHFFRSLGCRYEVGPSEAYLYDSHTAPAFRGRGIAPALGIHVLVRLRERGVTRLVIAILPHNTNNLRARAKTGFRVFERLHYFRLGRRSWHRHRKVAAGARPS